MALTSSRHHCYFTPREIKEDKSIDSWILMQLIMSRLIWKEISFFKATITITVNSTARGSLDSFFSSVLPLFFLLSFIFFTYLPLLFTYSYIIFTIFHCQKPAWGFPFHSLSARFSSADVSRKTRNSRERKKESHDNTSYCLSTFFKRIAFSASQLA